MVEAIAALIHPDRGRARRLTALLEGLGVSTLPASYGLSEAGWRALVIEASQGERGRNFIGRHDLAA